MNALADRGLILSVLRRESQESEDARKCQRCKEAYLLGCTAKTKYCAPCRTEVDREIRRRSEAKHSVPRERKRGECGVCGGETSTVYFDRCVKCARQQRFEGSKRLNPGVCEDCGEPTCNRETRRCFKCGHKARSRETRSGLRPLPPVQLELLRLVSKLSKKCDRPLSQYEIRVAFGRTVQKPLESLRMKGYIDWKSGQAHSIRVLREADAA